MSFDKYIYYPGQDLEHFRHPQTCSCVQPRVTKCLRLPKTEGSARIVPGKLGQLITLFVYSCSLTSFVSGYHQSAFCHCRLVFPVLEFHMNGIIYYLFLTDFFHFSIMFLRFIHIIAYISNSFLCPNNNPFYRYGLFLVYLSFNR